MKFLQLLEEIRRLYVQQLSTFATAGDYHIEPALRRADGEAGRDGELDTPCRYDFVEKATGLVHRLDAVARVEFAPFKIEHSDEILEVTPFTWDALTLEISGLQAGVAAEQVRQWFMRWFDENDANPLDADTLHGVPHYVSDPRRGEHATGFDLDLGSISAVAVAELIEQLFAQGAKIVRLGVAVAGTDDQDVHRPG